MLVYRWPLSAFAGQAGRWRAPLWFQNGTTAARQKLAPNLANWYLMALIAPASMRACRAAQSGTLSNTCPQKRRSTAATAAGTAATDLSTRMQNQGFVGSIRAGTTR